MKEDQIHASIIRFLDMALPNESTPAWHTPNGGARNAITGAMMKRLGTRAGFPDICFLHAGTLYAIEVKTENGRQSDAQKTWQANLERAGGKYAIARSVTDAQDMLKKWGVV